ncbi:MAG: BMP family ABC transporter substrate-binding protein [Candidatus Nanopelagicaceae bacterium]|nr:BMP family ABC transporter substrate-binding protein [Candidatus Nanopelagicaceae bacterium]
MKKSLRYGALLAATTLAVGITVAPIATAATKVKACLALDTGGVDDKSFNASAWRGAQKVASGSVSVKYLAAQSDADYAPNIKKLVDEGCNVIIGVGFLINDAIVAAAKANAGTKFAIIDQDGFDHGPNFDKWPGDSFANLKGVQFATNQSAFQAGYLAAGFSKTGKVATYGGLNIPPVTIFMDGFAKGVAYYNKVKGKSVVALGWDTVKKDGTFVGGFSDQAKALQISKNFEQQGADVIFPVAGGLGGATAGQSLTGKKSVTIWVDSDGYVQAPQYRSVLLTSVVKGVDTSVSAVIKDVAIGKFSSKGYMGTLANRGTNLASYHDLAKKVAGKLQNEVRQLGVDIKTGKVKVD